MDHTKDINEQVTLSELAEHNSVTDCWLCIQGRVLDVSSFVTFHPGGTRVLAQVAGTDSTDAFENAMHSDKAVAKLKSLPFIGELSSDKPSKREDLKALGFGIVFLICFCGLIALVGMVRWPDSATTCAFNDGYGFCIENETAACHQIPLLAGRFGPDLGGGWYFWKLANPTIGSRVFVWMCYVIHLVGNWMIVWWAHSMSTKVDASGALKIQYQTGLRNFNYALLAWNAGFHIMHLIQTHATYDGLAQDVSVSSSQFSVIYVLVLMMTYDARKRGTLFGLPLERCCPQSGVEMITRYHGYYVIWASIYTFWFHPCEPLWGHLFGFMHTGMICLQGSLIFTNAHRNPFWRFVLLGWVVVHAVVISSQTAVEWVKFSGGHILWLGTSLIPAYFLPRAHWLVKMLPTIPVIAVNIILVAVDDWYDPWRIMQIPPVYWAAPIVLAWVMKMFDWLIENVCGKKNSISDVVAVFLFLLSMGLMHFAFIADLAHDNGLTSPYRVAVLLSEIFFLFITHLSSDILLGINRSIEVVSLGEKHDIPLRDINKKSVSENSEMIH